MTTLIPSTARNEFYDLETHLVDINGLLPIRGTWFFVDPLAGSDLNDGLSRATAVARLQTAHDLCTTNIGDGICVMSADATTYANTTSFQKSPLVWSKNSITVIGVCAPVNYGQRARVENLIVTKTATTISYTGDHTISDSASGFVTAGFEAGQYLAVTNSLTNTNDFAVVAEGGSADFIRIDSVTASTITTTSTSAHVTTELAGTAGTVVLTSYNWQTVKVTGHNNIFKNLLIVNLDNTAYSLDALYVSGQRNYFENVHSGNGLASAATILARSLALVAAAENTFRHCVFGLDTVDRGNNATYDIYLSGAVTRNRFYDCETIRHTTVGVANFAVYLNATSGGRPTIFDNCRFTNWSTASGNAVQTAAFGYNGAGNDDLWLTGGTSHPGYGTTGLGGYVWISGANIASGVGGVLTTQA